MGTYYTASTIIGYKVSKAGVFASKVVPNCDHKPSASAAFCPSCGARTGTRIIKTSRAEWDKFRYEFIEETKLPFGFVYEEDYDGSMFWIGYGSQIGQDSNEYKGLPFKSSDEIKAVIKEIVAPYTDLFTLDEIDFGVWTIYTGR